jgi:hypothetical protein
MSLLDKLKSLFAGGSAPAEAAHDHAGHNHDHGTTPPVADVGAPDTDDEGMGAMSTPLADAPTTDAPPIDAPVTERDDVS